MGDQPEGEEKVSAETSGTGFGPRSRKARGLGGVSPLGSTKNGPWSFRHFDNFPSVLAPWEVSEVLALVF